MARWELHRPTWNCREIVDENGQLVCSWNEEEHWPSEKQLRMICAAPELVETVEKLLACSYMAMGGSAYARSNMSGSVADTLTELAGIVERLKGDTCSTNTE